MNLAEKTVVLRDKTLCVLKSPGAEDAEALMDFLKAASKETAYLLRYPEEWKLTIEQEERWLEAIADSQREVIINAVIDGELAGNASINSRGNLAKTRHRASFAIAVREKFWHRGLGSILMEEAIKAAAKMGYEQIELGVFSDNRKAVALYKKYGFEEWGRIKKAFQLKDGTYRDEIQMGLFLNLQK